MKKIITILCAICLVSCTSKAQNIINNIQVVGFSEIELEPDVLEYNITLQEYYKTETEKVTIEILEKNLIKSIEEIGLKKDNLTIKSVTGSKRYNYSSDAKPTNYTESRVYTLRIKSINDINSLVPKLDKMGLINTSLVRMTNKKKSDVEKELTKKAIRDAESHANTIAQSVGKKISSILTIQKSDFEGFPGTFGKTYDLNTTNSESDFKTEIMIEKIRLACRISITFQMK